MAHHPRILLYHQKQDFFDILSTLMTEHGYKVSVHHNKEETFQAIQEESFDLAVISEIKNAHKLCYELRKCLFCPIILLSDSNEDSQKILALESGADNFLTRPFNPRVILAYIQAALRRYELAASPVKQAIEKKEIIFEFSHWNLNITTRILSSPQAEPIRLSNAEYMLLLTLAENPQRVMSRESLLELTHTDYNAFDRSIDILISRLRAKIEFNPRRPKLIVTVRNSGYMLSCPVNKKTIHV